MTRKRGNGEGTIFREKSGRYRISISVYENGKRTRRSRIAHKYAEATAILDELRAQKTVLDPKRLSVAEYLEAWLKDVIAGEKADNTHDSYETSVKKHICTTLGKTLLRDLSPLHVQNWLAGMARDEVGSRTRQNAYTVLKMAIDHAVKLRLIPTNPLEQISKPKHEQEQIFPFTVEESKRIIAKTVGDRHHAICVLGLSAGLRQGEIFGLRWDCVDWKQSTVRIDQQAATVKGKSTIAKTKTKASNRTVVLTTLAIEALRNHRAILMTEGNASSELIFPAPKGGLTGRSNFRSRFWEPLLLEMAIEHRGFHHTRHTYATLALGAGVSPAFVSEQLGHAKVSTTLDIYSHVLPTHRSEAANAISKLLG